MKELFPAMLGGQLIAALSVWTWDTNAEQFIAALGFSVIVLFAIFKAEEIVEKFKN